MIFIRIRKKLIFMTEVLHLAWFWMWEFMELGNFLLLYAKKIDRLWIVYPDQDELHYIWLTLACLRWQPIPKTIRKTEKFQKQDSDPRGHE